VTHILSRDWESLQFGLMTLTRCILGYSSRLHFTVHYYTSFTCRCLVAAFNCGRSLFSVFPNCPPASATSFSQQQLTTTGFLHTFSLSIYLFCSTPRCYFKKGQARPHLWSSGQSSWVQIQRPGFDSRHYQIFWGGKKKNSSGSGTRSTQPRENNWGATW
jgi:hypothetical protein